MIKLLVTTAVIVFVALLLDVSLLHYQATVGKLPWKLNLLPNIKDML